jgi:hypothetical protein
MIFIRNFNLKEKKDHLIRRSPNLTSKEKEEIIKHFEKFPHKEKEIDWNKINYLQYSDFKKVMDRDSKSAIRKNVKTQGIRGLKEKEDYEIVYDIYPILSVVPKSWGASKFIASRDIGGIEGKWCTAYQKNSTYWNDYIYKEEGILVYTIDFEKPDKIAMYIHKSGRTFEFFNANNDEVNKNYFLNFLGITNKEYQEIIKKAQNIEIARKVHKKGDVWGGGTWEGGIWGGLWLSGIWEDGVWLSGTWENGIWKTGSWNDGTWIYGTWNDGIWNNGFWLGGVWLSGIWKDGVWLSGTWENGIWKTGSWNEGTWEDGTWENGFWQDGTWKDGTWEGGTWKDGTWEGGTWIKGKIKSIKFKDLILSYKNPEEFYELEREVSTKEELINLVGKK